MCPDFIYTFRDHLCVAQHIIPTKHHVQPIRVSLQTLESPQNLEKHARTDPEPPTPLHRKHTIARVPSELRSKPLKTFAISSKRASVRAFSIHSQLAAPKGALMAACGARKTGVSRMAANGDALVGWGDATWWWWWWWWWVSGLEGCIGGCHRLYQRHRGASGSLLWS